MKILIIEDEKGITEFLRQGLEEEAYETASARDGITGLEKALKNHFDLILLDWMLPGLNGIDVCRAYRKQNPSTPIIFLTAKDTLADTIEGLQSGANDFIKKPFHFEELLERIKVQLRPDTIEKETLTLGDIIINCTNHQVHRMTKPVHLTQKEFDLLEYLVRNKGRVCTRKELIENVWNIHFDYNTSVIDVFMNSLRKKLGLPKHEDLIRTVRGIGFIATES